MDKAAGDRRFEKITTMLVELGRGNFQIRAELEQDDEIFNAVLSGLNMLAEELAHFKSQLDIKTTLLTNTLYNISEVVYAIRITGNDLNSIRYEFISPRVHQLIGHAETKIYENASLWVTSIHPDDLEVFTNAINRLILGEELTCEYRVKHKDGSKYIWIEDRMSPKLLKDSEDVQIFCAARDVSKRKAVFEEREVLIKDLNNRYNELAQFNYIVSHNLRSPVASIIGACNVLKMPLDDAERDNTYGYMLQAATKLDDLIKDLNVILSTKSRINEKFEAFSVSEILQDIEQILSGEIHNSKATLHIDVTAKADPIFSVKSYIHSSLYNLISNALKYRKPDVSPKISVKVWKEYKTTYFEISDNGIGIDMSKHQNEVFGLYKRFNSNTEGKGLGLHMTKTQVEALGGNILVDSKPGKGTRFTIHLPQ